MRQITQQDIYRHYVGDIIIGAMYNSPIPGRQDDTPSFCLYIKNNQILWCDHGLPDQFGNQPENLVQYLKGIELTPRGYYLAKDVISREVGGATTLRRPLTQLRRRFDKKISPYVKGRADFEPYELNYWRRFNLNGDDLREANIEPLDFLSWTGEEGKPVIFSEPNNPAFIYWWGRDPASWKLYRPLADKRDKFRQDNVDGVIEGWSLLDKDFSQVYPKKLPLVIICSSFKDQLVVRKVMRKYNNVSTIGPRGESELGTIIDRKNDILLRADRVVILFDADDAGYKGSKKLAEATGFEFADMRELLAGYKDFSDYVDTERGNYSYKELNYLLSDILFL